ncbi:hypothetical protein KI387_030965 [Taxus chinensis]|uniref:Uncharacterized protein n=1 Tax=Taxus chinensis TaxID=29808 RepID=A0AA38CMC8_TAXCH|nr:hypothetical protein KI387_030965 [Taxus chinensis]
MLHPMTNSEATSYRETTSCGETTSREECASRGYETGGPTHGRGASTIVRESRKAVIRELIKLQEIVDAIAAEKTTESEPPAKNVEESVLPDKELFPEEDHVHMDIQASESNPASSFNTDLNSLENALEKKIILSDLENSLEKTIIIDENENEDNKDLPFEKNPEISHEMKIPKEKEKMGSLDENIDSKNSSQSVKGSSELLEDSSESVKDSSGPVTFSVGEGVDDDGVSIKNQEQVNSDMPQMETNESGSAGEDFRSPNREAILQEAFEMLDQIKSQIAECQLQGQKYNEVPLQGAEVTNIVEQDEVKLKEVSNEPELSIHSMEWSEESHAGEDASNNGKISQQDGKPEANNSEEVACFKKSDGTNNGTELLQEDITEANSSEEAACVTKSEGTNNNMESVSDKAEDDDNESRDESTTTAVENVWEENKQLKKVMEDLYQRNQMQNDVIGNISKKLEQLEKRMLQLKNNRKKCMGKRKRT